MNITQLKKRVAEIRERIATAERTISTYESRREPHLMAASQGDRKAIAALDTLRREVIDAAAERDDLQAAEKLAVASLDQAEAAEHEASIDAKVRQLVLDRIEDAIAIRRLRDEFDARCRAYLKKGEEIVGLRPHQGLSAFSVTEQFIGRSRLMVEIPQTVFQLIPNALSFMPSQKYAAKSLEESERMLTAQFVSEKAEQAA
jgi:hypothetical protein